MNAVVIGAALCLMVSLGCETAPVSRSESSNPKVPVELLLEHDGCKVYRFEDYRTHYFVKCRQDASVIESHLRNCGKGCVKLVTEEVPTVAQ